MRAYSAAHSPEWLRVTKVGGDHRVLADQSFRT